VIGVSPGSYLNLRAGAGTAFPKIGEIPADADGLANLGCIGGLSFAEWQKASAAEREAARRERWCRVNYGGLEGWVAGIYLTEGSAPAGSASAPRAETMIWRLIETSSGPAAAEGWIRFAADGTVSGNSGCNNFAGSVALGPGTVSFPGPLASTRMFCSPPEIMAQEDAVLSALAAAARYEFDLAQGRLTISGPNGEQPLVFEAQGR
jgi:heat shock protein HslJ